jgi:hypothetical protein
MPNARFAAVEGAFRRHAALPPGEYLEWVGRDDLSLLDLVPADHYELRPAA